MNHQHQQHLRLWFLQPHPQIHVTILYGKNPITQADAVEPCSGFHQDLQVYVGEHVMVMGAYVLDTEHGWNEIHPITSIDNIGG